MAKEKYIEIKGARANNLKNIDIKIPQGKFVAITGVSGSGKSSLAFDTLYAEGQRRYVESLSSYARQFLGRMSKPECDFIKGLPPAIAIEQKVSSRNPRSTVGTSTEIYDYLRPGSHAPRPSPRCRGRGFAGGNLRCAPFLRPRRGARVLAEDRCRVVGLTCVPPGGGLARER